VSDLGVKIWVRSTDQVRFFNEVRALRGTSGQAIDAPRETKRGGASPVL